MNAQESARAILPVYNAWHSCAAANVPLVILRVIEAAMWRAVEFYELPPISTDPILVGRWIADNLNARIDLQRGVIAPETK